MTPDGAEGVDELRRLAGDILGRAWSGARARAALDNDEPAWHPDLWATVVELGWVGLRRDPDDTDTVGEPEIGVLAEALGAALAPVPLAAAAAATSLGGELTADGPSILVEGPPARVDDGPDGPVVSGSWPSVPFGAVATQFVVVAGDASGESTIVALGADVVDRQPLQPLDRSPDASVRLDRIPLTAATVLGHGPDADDRARRARRTILLGRVAELVGVADTANAAAVEYAKERVAFGHPIGAFQAIKHRLVDQRASTEVARALVGRAARAAHERRSDADPLASLAAFWAMEHLRGVTEGALQVFGGIGYTWDHQAHAYLRRAACLTAALGERGDHRRRSAAWLVEHRQRGSH